MRSRRWTSFRSPFYLVKIVKLEKKSELALEQNEFDGDTLSNTVADFFHIFVIVLCVECEKIGGPHLTERSH